MPLYLPLLLILDLSTNFLIASTSLKFPILIPPSHNHSSFCTENCDLSPLSSVSSREMASEPAQSPPELPSFVENLISSRNRDISLFLPFILGLNSSPEGPGGRPDRIVLINPFTQGMVVIERSSGGGDGDDSGSSLSFESLIDELLSRKSGRPPASKAAIDAMESVEVGGGEDGGDQCVICLEEWEAGERAKRMPCDHRFHGECIEKWLKIHGSCPVCRYEMPVEEAEEEKKRSGGGGERRRGIWVSFTFGSERRTAENDDDASSERSRTSDDENVS